ncbi:glycosyltransferase family 2 protein [Bifidobacterium sp. LC6]|uniref:Glycosyltransferase family 2 protein n=1 Tax=Bifidobacterium colobi TaxID=2809026 RepID=A0ABS5UXF8_9BIFI|nr:glycosyltransferase family 2 protein [Bifidobacterium colobi]MBT1175782.1 glycosyltransferase family 2 protein [Bifidobacterium colobi]
MLDGRTVSLVMPCRNEASFLENLIDEIPDFFDEIVCVSNKSTDNTVEVGTRIQKHVPRFRMLQDDRTANGIGYGYAHMTGINAAEGDIIVCADSDGTYPVEDVPQLWRVMQDKGIAFTSCTRYPDRDIPMKLQLGVKILNAEIALLYGLRIHDSLSGMWIFTKDVVDQLHLTEGDWNLSPQIKLNAYEALGTRFKELKITQRVRYGETKQNYFETGMKHLLWIARNRFKKRNSIQPCV